MHIKDKKIPVAILGATGMVGQKFIELLTNHPWFEIIALAASDKSSGKIYRDAADWKMSTPLDARIGSMILQPCHPNLPCSLVFSSLSSACAGPIEKAFAQAGYTVISNSSFYRMEARVPLLIPEVNPSHLQLLTQSHAKKTIVTNPNCSVIGLAMILKPLVAKWGVDACFITTLQAISGAGYPGISAYDIMDNVIPHIEQEEDKIEKELPKILGSFNRDKIEDYEIKISAQCNRVAVRDGHMASISFKLKEKADHADIIQTWENFYNQNGECNLPSSPKQTLIYHSNPHYPQPKLHSHLFEGMSVSIGGLRKCSIFDWKVNVLSHNTIRGAAGCAILNAELLLKEGYL